MAETEHVHLKEFIERILDEREKALMAAAHTLEIRLDRLNELRAEVTRDRDMYVTKPAFDDHTRRIGAIEGIQSRIIGIGLAFAALTGIIGWVLAKSIK